MSGLRTTELPENPVIDEFVANSGAVTVRVSWTEFLGQLPNFESAFEVVEVASDLAVSAQHRAAMLDCDGQLTLTLGAALTLGDGFNTLIRANGGDITINPDGGETINGVTGLIVPEGQTALIWSNGSSWQASFFPTRPPLPHMLSPTLLISDTGMTYGANSAATIKVGQVIKAGAYAYGVADAAATDHHLTTAGGLKLYVLPDSAGVYHYDAWAPVKAFGTDDRTKLASFLAAIQNGCGDLGSGMTYLHLGIDAPDNAVMRIISQEKGGIAPGLAAASIGHMLRFANPVDVVFGGVVLDGHITQSGGADRLVKATMTGASTADCKRFRFEDCQVKDLQAEFWIEFDNQSANHDMYDCGMSGGKITTIDGCQRGETSLGTSCAALRFNCTNGRKIYDVAVHDVSISAAHIKMVGDIRKGIERIRITGNRLDGLGSHADFLDNVGCYAFNFYGDTIAERPRDIFVDGNVFKNFRSCGVYFASASNVRIGSNNLWQGQTDTVTASLPKGGVICNQVDNVVIHPQVMRDIAGDGIYWQAPSHQNDTSLSILPGSTFRNVKRGVAIYLNSSPVESVYVGGSEHFDMPNSGRGVYVQQLGDINANPSWKTKSLTIEDTFVRSGTGATGIDSSKAIELVRDNNSQSMGCDVINLSRGAIQAPIYSAIDTGLGISDLLIITDWDDLGLSTQCIRAYSCAKLHIDGVRLYDRGAGQTFSIGGSTGTLKRVEILHNYNSVRLSEGALGMGDVIPTFASTVGAFVQKIIPVEAGSAGDKYVVKGWTYISTGGWRELRELTGN